MSLPQRKIGPFSVSAIGLGCMNLSHAYGARPAEEDAVALLNHALDLGCNFLDTAALYGLGKNEELLGRGIMDRRNEFTLASKCVLDYRDGERILDGRPETIRKTLDEALLRLRTDVIDLYYLHRLDRNVPIEDSVGTLAERTEANRALHDAMLDAAAALPAGGTSVILVDVTEEFSDEQGAMREDMTFDGRHSNDAGRIAFRKAVDEVLAETSVR